MCCLWASALSFLGLTPHGNISTLRHTIAEQVHALTSVMQLVSAAVPLANHALHWSKNTLVNSTTLLASNMQDGATKSVATAAATSKVFVSLVRVSMTIRG